MVVNVGFRGTIRRKGRGDIRLAQWLGKGEAPFVFGIQIHRDRTLGILGLSHRNYIEKVLKRFGMQD